MAYAHTLDVPFYFDDYPNIVDNSAIHIDRWETGEILRATCESPVPNRPLAYLSFAVNFYFGGYQVPGYHLVNILMHLGAGALLFWLVRVTLEMAAPEFRPRDAVALLAAMIWLLHPLQTQTVTYIVQRMTVMAGFFYLAALCLYVCGRRAQKTAKRCMYWLGGALAWGCALASKEIALTLPAAIWLYEWSFFQGGEARWLRRSFCPAVLGILVMALMALIYTDFDPLRSIFLSYGNRDFSLCQRLVTQPRVVLFYVTLLLWPYPGRLSLLHPIEISRGVLDPPATLAALLVIVASVVLGFWLMRKDRIIAFALFWFLGHLVIESSVVGLEMIYEHRLYLPTMFIGLAICRIMSLSLRPCGHLPALVVMGACCGVLGLWTIDRNEMWRDPVAFWTHTVNKVPESARARSNLAAELMRQHDFPGVVVQLEKALALDENLVNAHLNMAEAKYRLGDDEEALAAFEKALHLTDGHPDVLVKLAAFNVVRGRHAVANDLLRQSLASHPNHAGLINQLGRVCMEQKKLAEARAHFETAIAIDPGFSEAHDNLGQVLFAHGQVEEAIGVFQKAVRLAPNNPNGHFNLGFVYEQTGRFAEAVVQYEKVVALDPDDADVLYRAGFLMVAKLERFSEGIQLLNRALKVAPEDPRAAIARKALRR